MTGNTRPLRIAHILGSFEIGGAEQVVLNLVDHQVRDGHQVYAISLTGGKQGPHEHNLQRAGATTLAVPKYGPRIDPSLPLRLCAAFKSLRLDVVHTHNPLPGIYGPFGARLAGIPCVHTKHGANEASRRSAWLRRTAHRTASALVAVSAETARQATEQGEAARDVRVIENGIPLSAFSPNDQLRAEVRRELEIPENACIIGTVARLSEVKNQPLLVRAMGPLLGPEVRLVIVGEGPYRPQVEQAVAQLPNRQYVHLLGQRLDVPRLLTSFDIFALSSDSEGLPMVLPEAMACALPVVSTAVGGIPDVVAEGVNGYLAPKGDELALRDKLSLLIQNPQLRREFASAARSDALQRRSSETMHQRYMDVYRDLSRV
jgi:glycosyltransferase involved in cell wall biosynthesis